MENVVGLFVRFGEILVLEEFLQVLLPQPRRSYFPGIKLGSSTVGFAAHSKIWLLTIFHFQPLILRRIFGYWALTDGIRFSPLLRQPLDETDLVAVEHILVLHRRRSFYDFA